MRREVERAIELYLGNPFAPSPAARDRAGRVLDGLEVPTLLSRLVGERDVRAAKRLLLAVGHRQASSAEGCELLGPATLPRAVERALPRRRGAYVAIAAAAGRAFRALSRIRGSSEATARARRDTWAACFGDSLVHALDLQEVIVDHDVLVLGETGTGKELFASAIQEALPGPPGGAPAPRSAINAAAIPDTLVESELFGHVKGAFTGASETRTGRLRSADGGSFFLDEVGDLPTTTQVKLLRVMETNEVYPLGSDAAHQVAVRYVAATHKDLEAMVERGAFRGDLFQRMAGSVLRIPPLRDRPEDIVEIGRSFLAAYLGVEGDDRSRRAVRWMSSDEARRHRWPGNVRELQNALRNLLLGLDPGLRPAPAPDPGASMPAPIRDGTASLEHVEDWYLARVLAASDGNYSQAARVLGVDRSTVKRRTTDHR